MELVVQKVQWWITHWPATTRSDRRGGCVCSTRPRWLRTSKRQRRELTRKCTRRSRESLDKLNEITM